MEKLAPFCFIKQVVRVTVPTTIFALKFYNVGFYHQLVFLVWEFTIYVWTDLLDFYRHVINFIVSLVNLGFLFEILFDCVC